MELTTYSVISFVLAELFMMSKIQNLNGTHNLATPVISSFSLFMMSKIQNLNGTHNIQEVFGVSIKVVYDVKDTKFEWNSQRLPRACYCCFGCL